MIFSSVPSWMDVIAYVYIAIAIISSLIIMADIFIRGNRQMMPVMDYVWPITSLYLSVFGLWAYWEMGRPDSMNMKGMKMSMQEHMAHMGGHMHHKKKPFWQSIFVSATHCGAGCEIGDFVGEWAVFLLLTGVTVAGSILYIEYAVDFILAYALGIAFQYIPISQANPKRSKFSNLKNAVKADSLSLIAFEVGLFGWMAIFNLWLFAPGVINPSYVVYWFMMQIGMFLGHFTSYPANWLLVRAGIKEGM
ncbi:MAG: DUF4396 domain-containing protein [Candidatus Marsarchaeota archaeon]|nr:DUF4396 domain-containing protein [Candidatus Marsarchaeota archaeon]